MNDTDSDIRSRRETWAARRKSVRARPISVKDDLVRFDRVYPDKELPLVIQASFEGIDLMAWVSSHLEMIEANLLKHGGILFRGFDVKTEADLERFLDSLSLDLMSYMEGATPRTELKEKIYTSTEYPADQSIFLHNELTYVIGWPMRIIFFCVTPAAEGGETPIADVRKVLGRIAPEVTERFSQKGWMLVRNYGDGLSLPWQAAFRTHDRSKVEEYCNNARIEFEWRDDDRLRTRQVRPAIARHPKTGESVWFNHVAFWHVSRLEAKVREAMLSIFKPDELPYNTYYGDGSTIEDSIVEQLYEAYRSETVSFPWQAGDILLLDNMLAAHGRNPFAGQRRILVAMGEPFTGREV